MISALTMSNLLLNRVIFVDADDISKKYTQLERYHGNSLLIEPWIKNLENGLVISASMISIKASFI